MPLAIFHEPQLIYRLLFGLQVEEPVHHFIVGLTWKAARGVAEDVAYAAWIGRWTLDVAVFATRLQKEICQGPDKLML